MTDMVEALIRMLSSVLFVTVIQNIVFGGAFGIDESVRAARKPRYLLTYGFWVSFFSLSLSVIGHFILPLIEDKLAKSGAQQFLACIIILTVIYLISALICKYLFRADKKYMNSLGMCAFNSLVLSLPFIGKGGLAAAVGYAVGAAISFVLGVLIIRAAMRHINNNPHIPKIFRGTPALFIYISLVSLALSCISGGVPFIS